MEQILDMILEIGKEITEIDYNIKEDNDTLLKRIRQKLEQCKDADTARKRLIDIWYERGEKVRAKHNEEDRLWDEIFDSLEDYYWEEVKE